MNIGEQDLAILNWIREAKHLYQDMETPYRGTGMCYSLSSAFKFNTDILDSVGQIILHRLGKGSHKNAVEWGLLGDNMYILHTLIPEFNFVQMEGDLPRMQTKLGFNSIPPEDFRELVKENPERVSYKYWWNINDTEIRLRAFDKLISIYQNKVDLATLLKYSMAYN